MAAAAPLPEPPAHPLAPLDAAEVEHAAHLAKAKLGERAAFCSAALVEPPKDMLRDFANAAATETPRKVRLVGYDHPQGDAPDAGFDAVVDLSTRTVAVERIAAGQSGKAPPSRGAP